MTMKTKTQAIICETNSTVQYKPAGWYNWW